MKMNIKKYIHNFGWKIFLVKAIRSKFYDNYSKFGIQLSMINERNIKKFLQKNIINNINKIEDGENLYKNLTIPKNSVIWTMWWQGIDNAPDIVRACIRALQKNNPDRKVIILTKRNYHKYVHINSKIIEYLNNGNITITHFSDILRSNLLYLYGGVWVDSTVWTTKKIKTSVFSHPFYTIKTEKYTNDPSHGRWTTFFMESQAESDLFNFVRKCFDTYCLKYNMFIDYILFDYFIALAFDNNENIRENISNVSKNNQKTFELINDINKPKKSLNKYIDSKTYLYKLTYKKDFKQKIYGNDTIYSSIIKTLKIR